MDAFSHIAYAANSDIGRKRKNNEDAFGTFPSVGVFCVADGMGGGDDGEVASAATVRAIESFANRLPLPENATYSASDRVACIRARLNDASAWIFSRAMEKRLKGCGSTFVGVCFNPSKPEEATALHAGDSRLYRIRGRSIQQITKDHSAAELIGAKDESEVNPMFRGMILRAVGIQSTVNVEATSLPLKEGDKILLCSDGLTKMLPDKKLLSIVREGKTLSDTVDALIAAANGAGGFDNITVELIEVGKLPVALPIVAMPSDECQDKIPRTAGTAEGETQDTDNDNGVAFEVDSAGDGSSQDSENDKTSATMTTSAAESVAQYELSESGDEKTTEDTEDRSARQTGFPTPLIAAAAAVLVVVLCFCIWLTLKNRAALQEAEEVRRQAEVLRAAEEARKAEIARQEREVAERREAERKAEETRRREEELRKEREEQIRKEKERKEREEALRREKLRLERERCERERLEVERRAAEKREREAAERERQRIAAEKAAKELAGREAERKAALKRAEEELARKEETLQQQKADELKRIRKEQADAQERAAELQRKRIEVLSAFEEVCEQDEAVAFVRKVSGIIGKEMPSDIYIRFRPLSRQSALSREKKLQAAVELTRDVRLVVVKLVDYAKEYRKDVEEQLTDQLTTSEYRKELADIPRKIEDFLGHAEPIVNGDPANPEVQFKCVLMIHSVPRWF